MTEKENSSVNAASRVSRRIDHLPCPSGDNSRAIELTNGAGAYLIQRNSKSCNSKVVVTIGAGRLQDPPGCRGIAELCVQLTLLEVNPRDIKQHFTTLVCDDVTIYYFEIDSSFLPDILEKLSDGIRNPRISKYDVKDELKSDKYSKRHPALDWLQRCSGSPAHPFHWLAQSGDPTVKSFKTDELLNRLINFHCHFYSGNLLRLLATDSRPLDELETLIANTFGQVPNRLAPAVDLGMRQLESVKTKSGGVKIRGNNMNIGGIRIVFPLPDQASLFKTSPDLYLKSLLLSQHMGGLKVILERRGLMLNTVKLMDFGQSGFDFFCIYISQREYFETHDVEDTAIKLVFRYLALIRSVGPQKLFHNQLRVAAEKILQETSLEDLYHFKPVTIMTREAYKQYQSQLMDDFSVATRLQRFPLRDVLSARRILTEYSPQAIEDFLNFLTPDRCIVYVSERDWFNRHGCTYISPNGQLCCLPKGQSVEYSIERLPPSLLNLCSSEFPIKDNDLDKNFKLPTPNQYVPLDFSLKPRVTEVQPPGPRQLRIPLVSSSARPNVRLWFRQDDRFQSELAFISIDFILPIELTAENQCLLDILYLTFRFDLCALNKEAGEMGLEISISRSCSGIQICFSGHSEPLPRLLTSALHRITALEFTQKNIDVACNLISMTAKESTPNLEQLASGLGLAGFLHTVPLPKPGDLKSMTLKNLRSIANHFLNVSKQAQQEVPSPSQDNGRRIIVESSEAHDPNLATHSRLTHSFNASRRAQKEDPSENQENELKSSEPDQSKTEVLSQRHLFADILVFGNVTADDAIKVAQSILAVMPSLVTEPKTDSDGIELHRRERLLSKGSYNIVRSSSSASSVCSFGLQIPTLRDKPPMLMTSSMTELELGADFGTRTCHNCLLHIISTVSNYVQLADAVDKVSQKIYSGLHRNCFVLEMYHESPAKMEKDIESFIVKLGDHLSAMSSKQLEDYKQVTLKSLLELTAYTCILDQSAKYWTQIMIGDFDFGWDDPRAAECFRAVMDGILKEDLLNYWTKWFHPGSPDRTVLELQHFSGPATDNYETMGTVVTDLAKFKECLESAPPAPFKNILEKLFDA